MTNEAASLIYCTVDDEKSVGKTKLEESEDIVYHWLNPEEFKKYLKKNKNIVIANDVMAFMLQFFI